MLSDDIRALLRSEIHADGLTVPEISNLLGQKNRSVWAALRGRSMPDAYIDRWCDNSAVWICVPVPEDCPRPRKEP